MMLSLIRSRPLAPRQQQHAGDGPGQPPSQAVLTDLERQHQQQQQPAPGPSQTQPRSNSAFAAFVQATMNPVAAPTSTSTKVSRRVRLERDANATLFGPSLANYFPSSATPSTTAAVTSLALSTAATTAAPPPADVVNPSAVTNAGPQGPGTVPPLDSATAAAVTASTVRPADRQTSASASLADPAPSPSVSGPGNAVSSVNSATLRRPRLGSSGRARGASLSNLSVVSLASPNPQSPATGMLESPQALDAPVFPHAGSADGGVARPAESARLLFPQHRRQYTTDSTWSYPDQNQAEHDEHPARGQGVPGEDAAPFPLADAIQLGTVHRWLQRAAGGGGATLHASSMDIAPEESSHTPTHSVGDETGLDAAGHEVIPLTELARAPAVSAAGPSVCTILQSYVNLKRNTFRLTLGPNANAHEEGDTGRLTQPGLPNNMLAPAPSAPILAQPTHILHFEYDCAAPRCAIHVFVRASRKHGSWSQAVTNPNYSQHLASASTSQTGTLSPMAPPHILGFPILAATSLNHKSQTRWHQNDATTARIGSEAHFLPLGFAQKRSVALRLDMSLYTPPTFTTTSKECAVGAASEQERSATEGGMNASKDAPAEATLVVDKADIDQEKDKLDKDKSKTDKETLKVAIVIEALDEEGKPLSEPNLQTTYLRLTSVPGAAQSAAAVRDKDGRMRVWSAQVEAQEAEIGPLRFQLQELFALSTRPPPPNLAPTSANIGETAEGALLTTNTDGAGAGDIGEAEQEAREIPTEVPGNDLDVSSPAPAQGGQGDDKGSRAGTPHVATYMPPVDEGTTGSECLICLTSPPSTLLLPCTHGLCLECAIQLRESVKNARDAERRRGKTPRRKYACPVCRRAYTSMLHLSTADEKQLAQASAHGIV